MEDQKGSIGAEHNAGAVRTDISTRDHGIDGNLSHKDCRSPIFQILETVNTGKTAIPRFSDQIDRFIPYENRLAIEATVGEANRNFSDKSNLGFLKRIRFMKDIYKVSVLRVSSRSIVQYKEVPLSVKS